VQILMTDMITVQIMRPVIVIVKIVMIETNSLRIMVTGINKFVDMMTRVYVYTVRMTIDQCVIKITKRNSMGGGLMMPTMMIVVIRCGEW
jgi:hypothetical protein